MSKQTDCLLIVTAQIDTVVEDAWNEWYDRVHLPAALACPGVISGARYVSQGEASNTDHGILSTDSAKVYTTIYKIEGLETLQTPEFVAMRGWYQFSKNITAHTQVIKQIHNAPLDTSSN